MNSQINFEEEPERETCPNRLSRLYYKVINLYIVSYWFKDRQTHQLGMIKGLETELVVGGSHSTNCTEKIDCP